MGYASLHPPYKTFKIYEQLVGWVKPTIDEMNKTGGLRYAAPTLQNEMRWIQTYVTGGLHPPYETNLNKWNDVSV